MIKIIIITILFLLLTLVTSANAYIPVTYSCCINYVSGNSTLLDGFENITDWIGKTGASKEADIINLKEGRQGLKLITKNGNRAYTDKVINNNFSNTNNFALWIYIYNASTFNYATIYFTSTGSVWKKYFTRSIYISATGWNKLVFGKNSFTNTGGEDWSNVMNRIRIAIGPKTGQNTNATIDDLKYNISGKRAKIIITFDDGYSNVYSDAYPILRANNQSAVAFVTTSSIGNKGKMNLSNLRDLQSSGWDISSHTVDHPHLATINDSIQYSELKDSYNWLVTNKFQKSAGFVAYPYGSFNDVVLNKAKQIYIFGRATVGGSTQQHFIPTDENSRYTQRVIGIFNDTTVQSIKDQINDSINSKLLGILLFHEIVDSNPWTYEYLKTDLQTISDYIKSRSTDIDVITYSDYVIPNINSFTPVINKTTRIYSNGTAILVTNNKYDEYMPNMTIRPSSGSIDIGITTYNETGGLVKFNESSLNSDIQVSYEIGDRIPNQLYSVKIYWANGTKYQDFNVLADSTGYISYNSRFEDSRYQEIDKTDTPINVPLSILESSPVGDPITTAETSQIFEIGLNKTTDVTWYINDSLVQTNSSVISANYTNSTADIGVYNVTAIANDGYYTVSRTWNWTVAPITPEPRYNVSGYVSDNYGSGLEGVLVQNGSYQNITVISGYYIITGLSDGTYNFSYSKTGFDTGYLEVIINGADNDSANITIYDTIPPVQVTELINDTPTQTTVNLSWNPVADANHYQIFRNGTSLGYTQNIYWNDIGLTEDTLYQYEVRANDSYNNWGQNSSVLNVKTAKTVNIPLSIVSFLPISDPITTQGVTQNFNMTLNKTANLIWYINGSLVQTNTSIIWANYVNSTAGAGIWNITTIATDGIDVVSKTWNWTVNVQYPVDTAPPATSISLSGTLGNNSWYISNITVTLTGIDISGINYTTYRVNSGSWLTYTIPFLVSTEGTNTVEYYSVDNANNIELTKSQTIKIDKNPPGSITNIRNTHGRTYINWTWKDPNTLDFAYVMVYINGVFKTNVTKGVMHYNATDLLSNTNYKISTHTVDVAGNINPTWVNNTVRTSK